MYYKPSRFNFRTPSDDGTEMILYNSMEGSVSTIPIEKRDELKSYLSKNVKLYEPLDDLAQELAENGFLIKNNVNEDEGLTNLIESRNQNSELTISIMPTEDCNFRCVYCFEHFKRGAMRQGIQDGIFEFIRKNLESSLYTSLHINWFGGEPMYSMDVLYKLGSRIKRLADEKNIPHSSSITTNGYFLNQENLHKLLEINVSHFTITLDGLEEEHNKTRVHRNGGNTFATIYENLKNMKASNESFLCQIRHNYTVDSFLKLDKFLKFLKAEFVNDQRFNQVDIRPIFDNGGYNTGNFDDCIPRNMKNEFSGLVKAAEHGIYNRMLKHYIQPGGIVCNASQPNYWLFGSDGKIMKCNVELDTHERNIVGKVDETGNPNLDYEKLSMWLDAGKDDSKCASCYFAPSCQGAYCAKLRFDNEEKGIKKQPCPREKIQLSNLLRVIHTEMLELV